jgi:cell wall-associated NlpC family hydrolase
MKNNYLNTSVANINSKPSSKSEVLSQILYGEKFKILNKKKKWVKIKTNYDNYIGYIKNNKFYEKFLPLNKYLYFASGIPVLNKNKNFIEFKKNKWIKTVDTKEITHQEKDFAKIIKLFLNTKYLWGGKTADGIDCSALIQIYFYYNRIFFPRDSKDQIKFCKKKN